MDLYGHCGNVSRKTCKFPPYKCLKTPLQVLAVFVHVMSHCLRAVLLEDDPHPKHDCVFRGMAEFVRRYLYSAATELCEEQGYPCLANFLACPYPVMPMKYGFHNVKHSPSLPETLAACAEEGAVDGYICGQHEQRHLELTLDCLRKPTLSAKKRVYSSNRAEVKFERKCFLGWN